MAGPIEYKPISDYAAIGNLSTVALVGVDGSIDWCCFPHLDGGGVFNAILDSKRGGRFRVGPLESARGTQRYLGDTNVLETSFTADRGRATVTDLMPLWGDIDSYGQAKSLDEIHRILACEEGEVEMEIEWSPRFFYSLAPTTMRRSDGVWVGAWGDSRMTLFGIEDGRIEKGSYGPILRSTIHLSKKEKVALVTRWSLGDLGYEDSGASLEESLRLLRLTIDTWQNWVDSNGAQEAKKWAGEWFPYLVRSELALKLLTHGDTAAIAAAPTTSLPAPIGGVRNWDYRYTWIRDAAMTAQAFISMGHEAEALGFLYWIDFIYWMGKFNKVLGRDDFGVQVVYGIHGELSLEEWELPLLEGYRHSRPVRVGNDAAKQKQAGVYGDLLIMSYELARRGQLLGPNIMDFLRAVADTSCGSWKEPDHGIWEIRGEPRHYVYSKVMVWVALDRAIKLHERYGLKGDVDRWRKARATVRKEILKRGYDEELGSFVQSFDSKDVDAANLRIPLLGFLPIQDRRVQGTIDRVMERLTDGGLVRRYDCNDNLPGKEGAFGLCTFWLIDVLALSNRVEEAERLFRNVLKQANHVGLFSEQIDPQTGEFLGNFPQAFTHIGLINSAIYLAYAQGKAIPGFEPVGTGMDNPE